MKTSSYFMPYEEYDPERAKRLLPGVKLQVSRRTICQIAAEKFSAMEKSETNEADTSTTTITRSQAKILRARILAEPVLADGASDR